MQVRRVLVWTGPLLFAAACGPTTSTSPPLVGRTFLSTTVTEGGAPRALVGTEHLQLSFPRDGQLGASAGCNSIGGAYEISDGVLVMSEVSMTEIGCDAERHAQDDWYMGVLTSKPSFVVEGDTIVLDGGGVHIEYLDQEVATPDLELVGPTWTVDTIIDGEVASHAEWPTPATLVFAADGTVDVSTGCNGGTGTYSVSGDRLTFSDVAVTERGCADPQVQELEAAVLAVVHGPQPVTWEITVSRLSLRGQGAGLDLRADDGGA